MQNNNEGMFLPTSQKDVKKRQKKYLWLKKKTGNTKTQYVDTMFVDTCHVRAGLPPIRRQQSHIQSELSRDVPFAPDALALTRTCLFGRRGWARRVGHSEQ